MQKPALRQMQSPGVGSSNLFHALARFSAGMGLPAGVPLGQVQTPLMGVLGPI